MSTSRNRLPIPEKHAGGGRPSSLAKRVEGVAAAVERLIDAVKQLDRQQAQFECLVSDRIEQLERAWRKSAIEESLAEWAAYADGLC